MGVGAKRVRQLFEKARQQQPCIIFIDEIDALGKRGEDSNSERDATINEFLVQLDGTKNNDGIFIIGSTNFSFFININFKFLPKNKFETNIKNKIKQNNKKPKDSFNEKGINNLKNNS